MPWAPRCRSLARICELAACWLCSAGRVAPQLQGALLNHCPLLSKCPRICATVPDATWYQWLMGTFGVFPKPLQLGFLIYLKTGFL